MSNTIFVGNLAAAATESGLKETFGQHGTVVSVRIVSDRTTGRNKGFGFVEMSTAAEAAQSIQALDGRDWEGRALRVNAAHGPAVRPVAAAPSNRSSVLMGNRGRY